MSDDTTRTDGWSSNETSGGAPGSEAQSGSPNAGERVGFCQDCGKPLTQATARPVGTGVFCEPCLTARVGAAAPASGYTAVPPQAVAAGEPSPVLAWFLGLIPGVGAMYNGQFAKGIVHLIIFAILVSLSDNVNDIFGLFVFGWIIYMAFEAQHTAVARRDGLPLPNAFGFNDIGERMGFGRSWGTAGPARTNGSGAPPVPSPVQPIDPIPSPEYVPVNTASVGAAQDWVGYVPPVAGVTPDLAARRFPAGAFWLIGLGVLILMANLLPGWKLTERWWPPVLFAGLSVWTFTRRLHSGAKLVCIIRGPVILMVLAVMLALHAAYFVVTTALTISVLLIVLGALLLLERAAGAGPVYTPPVVIAGYPGTSSAADAQAEEARSRAAWAATGGSETRSDPDGTKGGQ